MWKTFLSSLLTGIHLAFKVPETRLSLCVLPGSYQLGEGRKTIRFALISLFYESALTHKALVK